MRNPFRRGEPVRNVVTIRAEDGTVFHTVHLNPPTRFGPNTLDIVIPRDVEERIIAKRTGGTP